MRLVAAQPGFLPKAIAARTTRLTVAQVPSFPVRLHRKRDALQNHRLSELRRDSPRNTGRQQCRYPIASAWTAVPRHRALHPMDEMDQKGKDLSGTTADALSFHSD